MIITYGIESDSRYAAVALPEGWGVQAITYFVDVECTTRSENIQISQATGSVTFESSDLILPESIDLNVSVIATTGIGRPGQFFIQGSGVSLSSQMCG